MIIKHLAQKTAFFCLAYKIRDVEGRLRQGLHNRVCQASWKFDICHRRFQSPEHASLQVFAEVGV